MGKASFARASAIAVSLAAAAGCGKPTDGGVATAPPARKAGLWQQSLIRDGQPGRLGGLKICVDAATDHKLSVFGRRFNQSNCRRSVTRDPGGVYHFSSTCTLETGATAEAMGTASGDFGSSYTVHTEVNVSGAPIEAMNGMHEIKIQARYLGPCPTDMRPGDVYLGSGMKVNVDRLPQIASALGGG